LAADDVEGCFSFASETLSTFLVVSYYTDDAHYHQYAARFQTSINQFGIVAEVHRVPDLGAWEYDCAQKARFTRDSWLQSRVSVIWIDIDATVEAPLSIFSEIDVDFAHP
jgi:hypothetical protein